MGSLHLPKRLPKWGLYKIKVLGRSKRFLRDIYFVPISRLGLVFTCIDIRRSKNLLRKSLLHEVHTSFILGSLLLRYLFALSLKTTVHKGFNLHKILEMICSLVNVPGLPQQAHFIHMVQQTLGNRNKIQATGT